MKNKILWAGGLSLLWWIQSCKSEPDPYANNALTLSFSNKVGNETVVLGNGTYKNTSGESFTVTGFNYFISNISLKKADGTVYTYPQDSSYFLIREANVDSKKVLLKGIPTGDYTELRFMIGVDSLRNTMDLSRRKGVLDPGDVSHDDGMYWSWNSGYIFLKLEGISPQVPADAAGNQKYRYHIGGFGGYNAKTFNNIRTVTLPLGSVSAKVGPAQQPTIEVVADIAKIFDGTQKISLAQYPTVMFADFSSAVANNYATMFKIAGVKD
ncbi:MAG: MbnP family protein [Spirosomataceae bacterium]